MPSGGARNRSGPTVDPNSGRSDRRGLKFVTLPAEGHRGEAPAFPLPDESAREAEVWAELWTSPQAAQWAKESWRHRSVAMYARWSVKMEDLDAPSSLGAVVHRLADTIGLTPAGLKENGWQIAADEVAAARSSKAEKPAAKPAAKPARRLRAVDGA